MGSLCLKPSRYLGESHQRTATATMTWELGSWAFVGVEMNAELFPITADPKARRMILARYRMFVGSRMLLE